MNDHYDAIRWRQLRDMLRMHGHVAMHDRLDDVIVMVCGERQTSEGATLEESFEVACRRCGLQETRMPLDRDTVPTPPDEIKELTNR